jgi:hypothetical protein
MPAVTQYRSSHGSFHRVGAMCVTLCACAAAIAATERSGAQPDATLVAATDMRPSVEVNASTLPRFDGAEGATRLNRVDITVLPHHALGLGFAVGMSNMSGFTRGFAPPGIAAPTFDFGLRWRYTLDSNYRFDITAYRRVSNTDAISLIENSDPSYGARVEMGMGSQHLRKGFVADHGFVGFQLEGGGRVTVKRKFGGPMFYYRNEF